MSPPAPPPEPPPAPEDVVVEWWRAYAHRVQAYALRHVDPHAAQEVVSETFLVAWRRCGDVPDDVLPWLLTVARNVIRHQHRTAGRSQALEQRLGNVARQQAVAGVDVAVTEREHVLLALAQLSEKHREALLLVAWDGLSRTQAAAAAGCRVATFDVRLSRARKQLARLLDGPDPSLPALRTTHPAIAPAGPGGTP